MLLHAYIQCTTSVTPLAPSPPTHYSGDLISADDLQNTLPTRMMLLGGIAKYVRRLFVNARRDVTIDRKPIVWRRAMK